MNLRLIIQPRLQRFSRFVPGCVTHIRIDGLPVGSSLEPGPTGANCCNRDGKDDGKIFFLATILDVIYQLIVHRGVYILEC
jgi:hypothetical protein